MPGMLFRSLSYIKETFLVTEKDNSSYRSIIFSSQFSVLSRDGNKLPLNALRQLPQAILFEPFSTFQAALSSLPLPPCATFFQHFPLPEPEEQDRCPKVLPWPVMLPPSN